MARLLELMVRKMKVWYLFFHWNGYFVGHKIGIRKGNYMMIQMANLTAFVPLFTAAHFLAQVRNDVQLQKLLKMACSVNITHEGHYLAVDEALEIYSVMFIKQILQETLLRQAELLTQSRQVTW